MTWGTVWIIGNGPSSLTFDHNRLDNESVLIINRGLFRYSLWTADAFFSLDRNFIEKHAKVIDAFKGEKHLALPEPHPNNIKGAHWYDWSHADGLCEHPKMLCTGCNSGYAAINLCYIKGSQEIHLVGYDMDPKDNDQHQFWSKAFNTMLPQLNERNIKVYNHNIHSHITAFPRIP